MSTNTRIEWCEATWSPITGCSPISEGCAHCYAKRMAQRLKGRYGYPADDPFKVTFHPERLEEPLKWKKPRMIFVCSMGDLFHEDVTDYMLASVFEVIIQCPEHRFLLLTKRPDRMKEIIYRLEGGRHCAYWDGDESGAEWVTRSFAEAFPNVWLGVTVENDKHLDRIETLLQIPAAVRFVSYEPVLGPVDFTYDRFCKAMGWGPPDPPRKDDNREEWLKRQTRWVLGPGKIDWVIAGGETGPNARPAHPDWFRGVRDQCQAAGVPFFFKHWGEWMDYYLQHGSDQPPWSPERRYLDRLQRKYVTIDGKIDGVARYGSAKMIRVGKKAAGRLLDGREWNEYPITLEAKGYL